MKNLINGVQNYIELKEKQDQRMKKLAILKKNYVKSFYIINFAL